MDYPALWPMVGGIDGRSTHRDGAWRDLVRGGPGLLRTGKEARPSLWYGRECARRAYGRSIRHTARTHQRVSLRIKMDGFDIIDRRFRHYVLDNAPLEELAGGFRWTEGPVWMGDWNCLLFQDLP